MEWVAKLILSFVEILDKITLSPFDAIMCLLGLVKTYVLHLLHSDVSMETEPLEYGVAAETTSKKTEIIIITFTNTHYIRMETNEKQCLLCYLLL